MIALQKEYNENKLRVSELQAQMRELANSGDTSSAAFQELSYNLAETQQYSNALSAEMKNLSAGEKEIGDNAGNASGPVASLGDMIMEKLAGVMTIAGVFKLADAIKQLIVDTADFGDNIDKMSQKMGMSTDSYQEWAAVMEHCGTSMETMKSSMKTLASAAETNSAAFERLGISQQQLASMSQEELFDATITALQNVGDTTERTYLAGQLLGRGATELGALLNKSAEETKEMRDRVHELGGVMSEEAVADAAAYKDAVQDLRTAWEGFTHEAASDWLPALTDLANGAADLLAKIHENGGMTSDRISGMIGMSDDELQRVERLKASAPEVAAGLSSAAEAGEKFAGAQAAMAPAVEAAAAAATAAEEAEKAALEELMSTMQSLSGEYPALASMAEAYGYSVQQTSQWLLENGLTAEEWANQVSGATDSVVNSFQAVGTDLGMSLDEMKNNLASNIEAYNNWNSNIQELMAAAVASGSEGAVAFVQYMQDMGIGAADQVQAMMSDVEGNLADFGSLFEGAGGEAMEAIYNQITGANLGEAASTAGAEIPEGLATGASSGQDSVSGAVEEVVSAAVDIATEADFAPAGTTEMESLASGISDAMDTVTSAAEDVVNAAKDAADAIEFATVGTARMDDLASGISDGADGVGSEAESAVEGAKSRAEAVDFTSVGLNLARGIASGITAGTGFIQSAAISAVNAAKAAAEAAAGIHSPSTVWRDEVGQMLTKGMAAGMVTSEAMSALEDAATEIMEAGVNQAQVAVKAWEKVYSSFYDTQEHELFMMKRHGATNTDIISWYKSMQQAVHEQAEHYRAMGVEENSRYIMDLEEQWWKYQDEIDDLYEEMGGTAAKTAKQIEEDFQKAYNEIMKAQEQMASKLASFDLWTTDKNGNSILADPREQIRLLQEYDRALEDMSKYVGDNLMNEILGMSTQQVVDYWHQLQQFGGEELNRYLTAYNKSVEMAQDIAEKYYANDVAELTEQYNRDMSGLQTEEYAQAQTAALTRISEQNAESISALNRIAESIQGGATQIQISIDGAPIVNMVADDLIPIMAARGYQIVQTTG